MCFVTFQHPNISVYVCVGSGVEHSGALSTMPFLSLLYMQRNVSSLCIRLGEAHVLVKCSVSFCAHSNSVHIFNSDSKYVCS